MFEFQSIILLSGPDANVLSMVGTYLIKIALAVVIFWVGKKIAGFIERYTVSILEKKQVDVTLSKFIGTIVYAILMTLVVVSTLDQLGVETASFAAILAAAGFAVGMALQGSLSNFAAGVMIILFRPFKAGDFIEAGGASGVVEEVHLFNTLMKTGDNVQVIVPNSSILSGKISNFSTKDTRRIDLVFGCGYNDNLPEVKKYLEEVVSSHPHILKEPAPVVAVGELGASSVDLLVRPWVASANYWAVRWELLETIKLGFDERGFTIPYQTVTVETNMEEATPESE